MPLNAITQSQYPYQALKGEPRLIQSHAALRQQRPVCSRGRQWRWKACSEVPCRLGWRVIVKGSGVCPRAGDTMPRFRVRRRGGTFLCSSSASPIPSLASTESAVKGEEDDTAGFGVDEDRRAGGFRPLAGGRRPLRADWARLKPKLRSPSSSHTEWGCARAMVLGTAPASAAARA
ncbi:hypothetical protein T492DRAFT_1144138 [Pavlovales sp. CCMP2436]|nr:hypothetical protein T492DRAFT_1144138 [Pavlovales sp. CCMP2436]